MKQFLIKYATDTVLVKLLNPYVMKREDAISNYRTAGKREVVLVENHIPVLAAHLYNEEKMQEIDGQYLYLFDWFDGTALQNEEITAYHCAKMGEVPVRKRKTWVFRK